MQKDRFKLEPWHRGDSQTVLTFNLFQLARDVGKELGGVFLQVLCSLLQRLTHNRLLLQLRGRLLVLFLQLISTLNREARYLALVCLSVCKPIYNVLD